MHEKLNTREMCVEAYMQFLKPGEKSGIHRHMWEELIFVVEGSGYDLHWDLKWDCLEAFQWEWAAEPKAYSWKRGDYIYIPPFTNHQHVAGDHEDCRLIVMSNRIVKEMGFDWFDQVANAPGFDPRRPTAAASVRAEAHDSTCPGRAKRARTPVSEASRVPVSRTLRLARRDTSCMTDKSRIGIVGVGRMGLAMLKHLVKHGHPVTACDLNPKQCDAARAAGARDRRDAGRGRQGLRLRHHRRRLRRRGRTR